MKCLKTGVAVDINLSSSRRHSLLLNRSFLTNVNRRHSVNFADRLRSDYMHVEPPNIQEPDREHFLPTQSDREEVIASPDANNLRPKKYKNRFLNFVRLSSVLNDLAESFFKSEIRRRLFVTSVLIVISRVGYFVPLPGFDRRLIPRDYLSFVSGSVGKLHTVNAVHCFTHICINSDFVEWSLLVLIIHPPAFKAYSTFNYYKIKRVTIENWRTIRNMGWILIARKITFSQHF